MWVQIVVIAHFYFQAISYARSIETSDALDRLINTSIRNRHPIVIIVNPPKNPGLDFGKDETAFAGYKDEDDIKMSNVLRSRSKTSCRQFLRSKIKEKCSDVAECTEVVWKFANKICGKEASD